MIMIYMDTDISRNYVHSAKERFLRYVAVDTMSDETSKTVPSTPGQKILAQLILGELKGFTDLNIDAVMDDKGYVYAKIPSNIPQNFFSDKKSAVPIIGFIAHLDTSPAVSGKNVRPVVHEKYDGKDIILQNSQSIPVSDNPSLKEMIGQDIITSDGSTLLGADDKAGIASIMDAVNILAAHPEIIHGEIHIAFTVDEEIGRGMNNFDTEKFRAEYAYTLDGGSLGEIECENFNASNIIVRIHGHNSHPGYAKGKMINAIKIAAEFVDMLPKKTLSPESTEGREGFVHPWKIEGIEEEATVFLIARDFDQAMLRSHEEFLRKLIEDIVRKYPLAGYDMAFEEQYSNMKEILDAQPEVLNRALDAMKRTGIMPKICIIRGGTDGSRLSFMGIPTANLFCGQHNFHSKTEYVSVQDMEKAANIIVEICKVHNH